MNSLKDSYNLNIFQNYHSKPNSALINRPMSALNKKSELHSLQKSKKNIQEFPNLFPNTSYNEIGNHKTLSLTVEKEKLYEELIYNKSLVNNLKKELSLLKSQNAKNETEINKKDKVIEDIVIDSQNILYSGNSQENFLAKAKEANLISKMKKQFRNLKKEFEEKCVETENLKKFVKVTKINELNVEIKTLNEELSKLKTLYHYSLQQNEINENNLKEMKNLQENFSKQHFIIMNFQENLQKTNQEIIHKNSEIELLKENLNRNYKLLEKLKKELTNANQMKEKFFKENNEKNEVALLQKKYEKQIAELNKEVNRYREIADRKDKTIRELENLMKKNNLNQNKAKTFSYNDIKYIQENPEEKYDNVTLLLKSKLMEALTEKENLEKRVKKLEEKLKNNSTGNSDHISERSGMIFSQSNRFNIDELNYMNEEQLTDFTYYLIKNFEAKKITHNVALKTILKDLIKDEKSEVDVASFMKNLSMRIFESTNVKLESDKKMIDQFIKTVFILSEQKLEIFLDKFSSIFYNVKTYKAKEETVYKKSLSKNLKNYEEELKQKIKNFDPNSTGLITFDNLKKIFESINLQINPDLIEYLIYLMKSSENEKMSLCDLNYGVAFNLIKSPIKDLEDISQNSIKENEENEEDSEIVITSDNFNEKVDNVLRQIDGHIKKTKQSARDIFKNHLFNLNQLDEFKNRNEEAIHLKDFIDCLNSINIQLIDIDLYCIYTKLKLVDEYDFVSIKFLEEELKNFNSNLNQNVTDNKTDKNKPNQNVDILDVDINQLKEGEIPLKNINMDFKNMNELNLANVIEDEEDYDLDLDKEVVLDEGFLDENLDENRLDTENKENLE